MFVDARTLPDGTDLEFDVCIVGSGPAGLTAALALRGSGLRVGVFESGGMAMHERTEDLDRGLVTGVEAFDLRYMRGRAFGGASMRWAGWCKPLRPEDFEERANRPMSGWPIRFDDVAPHYESARATLELGDLPFDAQAVAAVQGVELPVRDTARIRNELFQFSPPTRFATRYRQDVDEAHDVSVHLYGNLVDIVLERSLGRVDHLVIRDLRGTTMTVRAARYVLATGGVENARILLACDRQIPEGVANSSGLVGRTFSEHPHYYASAAWVLPKGVDVGFYVDHHVGTSRVMGVLALSPEVRAAEGLPGFTAELVSTPFAGSETGPLGPQSVAGLVGAGGESLVRLNVRCEQTPDPDSRVTLMPDDRDDLGMPRAHVHWQIREQDLHDLRRGLFLLGTELSAQGLGRLWMPLDGGTFAWPAKSAAHHTGTTRMSADPAKGVVDGDLRTHDVDNLYVLGCSVFPTAGDSNPTFTIVALAHRFAAHVRGVN